MAITSNKHPLKNYIAEKRLTAWLWLEGQRENDRILSENYGRDNDREFILSVIGNWRMGELLVLSNDRLLPAEDFNWISDDERQIKWLSMYIAKVFSSIIQSIPLRLKNKEYVVAIVDHLDFELKRKARIVERMRVRWNDYTKSDSIFKWFKGSEEKARCECAWEWLLDRDDDRTRGYGVIRNHEDLLIFFDGRGGSDAQKKLDVNAIKARWSQRKFREGNTGKKQCNFWVSNEAVADLDKLAEKYGVKRPQIIEALIRCEVDEGKYLSEKMKKIGWE